LTALCRPGADVERIVSQAPATWGAAVRGLLDGPDPQALLRATRLPSSVLAAGALPPALVGLLHQGGYASRMLAADPSAIAVLQPGAAAPWPTRFGKRVAALTAAIERDGASKALAGARTRAYLWLARRELEGAPLEEIGGALSQLVAVCIEALLHHHRIAQHVVVFGMGKLGGKELNFLSDIDLIFVHTDALGDAEVAPNRLAPVHQTLRRIVRELEGEGPFRPLFRVDLRLRPHGSRGPISTSLSATEAYYERYGRDWERQVWVRGRPIAGNLELGRKLATILVPFVYRRSFSTNIFDEIQRLMERARREATVPHTGLDIKLDRGTIREVEFAIQALQILHGGKNPSVRTPSTLVALDRLLACGLVSDREHRELGTAYRLFRTIEHRLQLGEGQQTHRLPAKSEDLVLFARRLHPVVDLGGQDDPAAALVALVDSHRARVEAISQTIARPETDERALAIDVLLDLGAPSWVRERTLAQFGVFNPGEADALIESLVTRSDGPFAARGPAFTGAANLLRACLDSADPDAALARLAEFMRLRPAHYGVWRFLADTDPSGRDLLGLTAELFGASEPLSRGLIGFPGHGTARDEAIELLAGALTGSLPDPASLSAALEELQDFRAIDASLLRFKHQQLVAIGLHDLGHRPDPLVIGSSLSHLADLIVRVIVRDLVAEQARDRPDSGGLRLAVLALGKYGMQTMDYGSDLDLIVVFDSSDPNRLGELQPSDIRWGQKLVGRLQDRTHGERLYDVDMRLRPSGRQGLLVSPLPGFRRYHARALPVWERLALLRLRPIAEVAVEPDLCGPRALEGDRLGAKMASGVPDGLCTEIERIVGRSLIHNEPDSDWPSQVAAEAWKLKRRIENEIGREDRDGTFHVKAGVGGCLELELLVSALQLIHCPRHPLVQTRGIIAGIEALSHHGILSPGQASGMCANYRFLRLFLNRLRMSQARGIADPDRISENSPRITTIARRMGIANRQTLIARYRHVRQAVRAAFEHHLSS
jgi:glutamate-ammonia-ligase adenylyltransferase